MVVVAQEEARQLGHRFIGTEHELLGLVREDDGIVADVFHAFGITVEAVREEVVLRLGAGSGEVTDGQIPFSPEAKKALELSAREAQGAGHPYVAPEHVLLAIARAQETGATQVLQALGADVEQVRSELLKRLPGPEPGPPPRLAPSASRTAPAGQAITALPDSTLQRVLMVSAGIALSEERTRFTVDDLLRALSRHADTAPRLASLGVDVEGLRARLERGDPPAQ